MAKRIIGKGVVPSVQKLGENFILRWEHNGARYAIWRWRDGSYSDQVSKERPEPQRWLSLSLAAHPEVSAALALIEPAAFEAAADEAAADAARRHAEERAKYLADLTEKVARAGFEMLPVGTLAAVKAVVEACDRAGKDDDLSIVDTLTEEIENECRRVVAEAPRSKEEKADA
jgi:hypothetical protein